MTKKTKNRQGTNYFFFYVWYVSALKDLEL